MRKDEQKETRVQTFFANKARLASTHALQQQAENDIDLIVGRIRIVLQLAAKMLPMFPQAEKHDLIGLPDHEARVAARAKKKINKVKEDAIAGLLQDTHYWMLEEFGWQCEKCLITWPGSVQRQRLPPGGCAKWCIPASLRRTMPDNPGRHSLRIATCTELAEKSTSPGLPLEAGQRSSQQPER